MTRLDPTMVRSIYPCLQIREDKVDHWQVLFCFLGIATKREGAVPVAHLVQVTISAPAVSANDRPGRYAVLDECSECLGIATGTNSFSRAGDNAEAKTAGIDEFFDWNAAFVSVFPFRAAIFRILTRSNLNRANDRCLVVDPSSFASRASTNAAFVYLNRVRRSDGITVRPNHASAELVKHRERRFVWSDPKLTLKLDGRLSGRLRRHEVSAPKPSRERHMARLHDGAGSEGRIFLASTATQHDRRPRSKAVWLAEKPALLARKAVRPPDCLQIARTRGVVREEMLELRKGRREGCVHA